MPTTFHSRSSYHTRSPTTRGSNPPLPPTFWQSLALTLIYPWAPALKARGPPHPRGRPPASFSGQPCPGRLVEADSFRLLHLDDAPVLDLDQDMTELHALRRLPHSPEELLVVRSPVRPVPGGDLSTGHRSTPDRRCSIPITSRSRRKRSNAPKRPVDRTCRHGPSGLPPRRLGGCGPRPKRQGGVATRPPERSPGAGPRTGMRGVPLGGSRRIRSGGQRRYPFWAA